jgi:tetratricopeptide (TPR) repeat protein
LEPSKAEIEIQRLLDREATLQRAANQVMEKIAANDTSDRDRITYWGFLFNAGFYQELLSSLLQRLRDNQKIHWGYLIETFALCEIKPNRAVVESVLKGLRRQNATEDLWSAQSWDDQDPRFAQLRNTTVQKKVDVEKERKESLLEKFNFLTIQRMRDQAARVLNRMIYLYPEEKEFRELQKIFDEEWARDILSQRFTEMPSAMSETPPALTGVEREMVDIWTELSLATTTKKKRSKKTVDIAYDLAVSLHIMDASESALKVAAAIPADSPRAQSRDWLMAELMLSLRRYVDLLDHCQHLEDTYSGDPETAFAVSYLRAQALKALGQSAAAVEILRNIVQVRPNYRSANHLVMEWSVGVATG